MSCWIFPHTDWPERVQTLQTNWIGRSVGAAVVFHTEQGDPLEIFTTRPDTLWGATFMVLAPEHPLVQKITTPEQKERCRGLRLAGNRARPISSERPRTKRRAVYSLEAMPSTR